MSYLVLHMDKFKKSSVRGIQSHNERERESHSNPDIDYARSTENYELHEGAAQDYAGAIQNRIDDLLLVKAVRKDAVHMCGLIVSSDSTFFEKLSPEETRRFFEESKAFLTEFVGKENVISAMVHLDEKTPHMHFLHVPITEDGRLNANKIYTRESLKKLQNDMPTYLQSRGFILQRGVEQEPGAAKKHLNTREFKQQQNALDTLQADLEQGRQLEEELQTRLQAYEQQAQEAEEELAEQSEIPQASMFNYKAALETAQEIIERQKKALAVKGIIAAHNEKQQEEILSLHETVNGLNKKMAQQEAKHMEEQNCKNQSLSEWINAHTKAAARLEEIDAFFRWNQTADTMFLDYRRERQQEAQRKAAEQRQKQMEAEQREKQLQAEKERQAQEQAKELERQKAQELEHKQQEREASKAQQQERSRRGMGMSR